MNRYNRQNIDKAYNRISLILKDISFHPEWKLSLASMSECYRRELISILVQSPQFLDSVNKEHQSLISNWITFEICIAADASLEFIIKSIHSELRSLVLHEFNEWFKYKGEFIDHPHPERLKS